MNRSLKTLALVVAFAIPAAALACEGDKQALMPKKVSVTELASMTKAKKVTPVDANGQSTRDSQGIIPGAVLLTSSSQYDIAKELPTDKASALIFYCSNERCSASKTAAVRAMEAGYQDVGILPVGIKGWKAEGQKTAKPNS